MSSIITVSQLNRYLASKIKEDKKINRILIRGEISNFKNHTKTGHLYFTLKDDECAINAVMFKSMAVRLNFEPESGMKVIITADVRVYERDGACQLYVNDMQPDGIGKLYLEVEQLKAKLAEEGIFDEAIKKELPSFTDKIGIVTSPDAAALQDIINIISRRYPIAEIEIHPCLVQGESAPESICSALKNADKCGADIIIVGRGGGSLEDLMAFNSEIVARCIYGCNTPVISAVGHETDITISDFAADLRAPTPSAAAELAVPDMSILIGILNARETLINEKMYAKINKEKVNIDLKEQMFNSIMPYNKIAYFVRVLDEKEQRLNLIIKHKISIKQALLLQKTAALDNLSPLKIMDRGYSLVYKDEQIIKKSKELSSGDKINVRFSDGNISAVVD